MPRTLRHDSLTFDISVTEAIHQGARMGPRFEVTAKNLTSDEAEMVMALIRGMKKARADHDRIGSMCR